VSEHARKQTELEAKLKAFVGQQIGPPEFGGDLVNAPMIRHWCTALEDENPAYTDPERAAQSVHGGIVAPPTMMQAWVLPGIDVAYRVDELTDKQRELHQVLSDYGYTSVVATNCDQGYTRYVRPGDKVTGTMTIESISDEKATALGPGYFIQTRTVFRDQNDEEVGWMTFRVVKFKPAQPPQAATDAATAPATPTRIRPPRAHDNGWWWEGIDAGKLLIQKCSGCDTLRHPPRPMCGSCGSIEWKGVEASGRGTVYSYVIMHHPPIPGYGFPIAVGLIDLEEGTRLVSNIVGCEHDDIHIGMKVEANIEQIDEELKLPLFRPVEGAVGGAGDGR
jgi:uncharacterized OB-fold protein/acyl dehydratase